MRAERPGDAADVRRVHQSAFAPSPGEASLVDALRDAGDLVPGLCLVAEWGGEVVGHIAHPEAGLGPARALALAPLAVLPAHQGQGVGSLLVRESLLRAQGTAYPVVIVLGHPRSSPRFGFRPAGPLGIGCPLDARAEAWMALPRPAYRPEARGMVRYAAPFGL